MYIRHSLCIFLLYFVFLFHLYTSEDSCISAPLFVSTHQKLLGLVWVLSKAFGIDDFAGECVEARFKCHIKEVAAQKVGGSRKLPSKDCLKTSETCIGWKSSLFEIID